MLAYVYLYRDQLSSGITSLSTLFLEIGSLSVERKILAIRSAQGAHWCWDDRYGPPHGAFARVLGITAQVLMHSQQFTHWAICPVFVHPFAWASFVSAWSRWLETADSSLSIPKPWGVCSLLFSWVCRINRLCLSYKWGGPWRSCLCYSTNILRLWNFPSGIIICEWILTFYNGKAWNHTRLGHCHYSFSRFILLTVKLQSCFTICGILVFFFYVLHGLCILQFTVWKGILSVRSGTTRHYFPLVLTKALCI